MILDDSTKLVGVRLPITALPTLRHHLAEAVQARKAVVDSGGGGKVEPVSPIDPKILLQVKTPPKNILSFFGLIPGASPSPSARKQPRGVAATPSPVGEKRRQAGGAFASGGAGSGSSGSGGGSSGGGGSSSSSVGRKKRKVDGGSGGKGGKENSGRGGASSASKGMAAFFGGRSAGGGGAADRKDVVPEVISIDDD